MFSDTKVSINKFGLKELFATFPMNWNLRFSISKLLQIQEYLKYFLCFVHFPFSQPPKVHNKEYKHYLMSKTQYLTSAVYRLCNGSLSHYHDGDLSPRPHLSWSCLGCGHSRLCYPAGPGPLAADTCSNPETRHVYTIYILIVLSERP